ncbi:hypothetical protein L6Q96_08650 [Candidatus Binatia bacterium]|nr:hypothetical protein [Candidatus Binatia bacterium]
MKLDRKDLMHAWARVRETVFDRERIRQAFTRNLSLKLLSLAIAFGLWAFVNFGERDAEESFRAALELRNIPPNLMITSPRVDFIDVRLVGPRTLLGRVDRTRLSIGLDLNGIRPGPAVFRLGVESLNLPRGVSVARINPAQVTLELEPVAQKVVPVRLRLAGKISPDLQVVDTQLAPETIEVTGPEAPLRKVDAVSTEKLDVSAAGAGTVETELLLEPVGDYFTYSADRVAVQVRIAEVQAAREIGRVAVDVQRTGLKHRVTPATVRVMVRGPRRLLEDLGPSRILVQVDANGLGAGTHRLTPRVVVPNGLEVVDLDPATVDLKLWTDKRSSRGR